MKGSSVGIGRGLRGGLGLDGSPAAFWRSEGRGVGSGGPTCPRGDRSESVLSSVERGNGHAIAGREASPLGRCYQTEEQR